MIRVRREKTIDYLRYLSLLMQECNIKLDAIFFLYSYEHYNCSESSLIFVSWRFVSQVLEQLFAEEVDKTETKWGYKQHYTTLKVSPCFISVLVTNTA